MLAQHWVPDEAAQFEPVRVTEPGVILHVWTSPYAPFIGEDELRALHTVAALTGIALDRVRLFEQEHASRLALEQQTARMASVVEQLLDLSRLDAEAVEIKPQELDLRQRLVDVVRVAAGARLADIAVGVVGPAVAVIDPSILDHIVTNLVTNALRYGQAPVLVSATVDGGHVRISVEDSGPGVAHEIEATLSSGSRGQASHATASRARASGSRSPAPMHRPTVATSATSLASRAGRASWSTYRPSDPSAPSR